MLAGGSNPYGFDYLCTTNQDNYYSPVFFEYMLSEMVAKKADFAYCDCVHSHRQWKFMDTKLKRGHIDLGCWIARAGLVLNTPWDDFSFAGDWAYIQKLQKSAKKIIKVPAALFVHN